MFGLSNNDIETIRGILSKYPCISEALIFGSRAKGNFKNGSDIDIALKGSKLEYEMVIKISTELNEETLMPYHFDIVHYNSLTNSELASHIDRVGILFFENTAIPKSI